MVRNVWKDVSHILKGEITLEHSLLYHNENYHSNLDNDLTLYCIAYLDKITKQKHHLHVSTGSSEFYTKSFYCSSILIWNDIMKNVDVSVSLFKFKKLKLYLLNNSLNLGYTLL